MPDADLSPATDPPGPSGTEAPPSFARWSLEVAGLVAVAAVISWLLLTFVVQQYVIPSSSMEDTLQIGDRVLVNKLAYRFGEPRAGDIVVFSSLEEGVDMIKRVVAVEGQSVEVRDGTLYVDGEPVTEPYVNRRYVGDYDSDEVIRVPDGEVYVLGDNRANSADSRVFGPQAVSRILGRAEAVVWPLSRIRSVRDR